MNSYTKQELIQSLQRAEDEIIPLTSGSFDANSNYPAKSTVSKEFGSWSDACDKAGVESGQVTEKSILHSIETMYNAGEIENSEDFFQHDETIAPATFYKYFDSWRNAVDTIGIDANSHYSDDELLEYIREFEKEYGYVSQRKFKYTDEYPSSTTVNRRWGSWNNAVTDAGIMPNEIGVAADEEPCGLKEELFGSNWHTQRERALERDSFNCRECGSETDLCVHHDKPRVTYRDSNVFTIEEANNVNNLITVCTDCHYDIHGNKISADLPQSSTLHPRVVQ
jgi:hypothetical protein